MYDNANMKNNQVSFRKISEQIITITTTISIKITFLGVQPITLHNFGPPLQ